MALDKRQNVPTEEILDIDVVANKLQQLIAEVVNNYFAAWQHIYSSRLDMFIKLQADLLNDLSNLEKEDAEATKVWGAIFRFLSTIRKWADVLLEGIKIDNVLAAAHKSFADAYEDDRNRAFIYARIEMPTAEFLLNEWLHYLHFVARTIYGIYYKSLPVTDDFLFLEQFETAVLHYGQLDVTRGLDNLGQRIESLKDKHKAYDEYKEAAAHRLSAFEAEQLKKLRANWSKLVTSRQAVIEKNVQKYQAQRQAIEGRMKNAMAHWQAHFAGEISEWQSGIDLSRLQLRVAWICRNTIVGLHSKIEEEFFPTLSQVQIEVKDTQEWFVTQKFGSVAELLGAIEQLSNDLLVSFRDRYMLQLTNALLEAQFLERVTDYSKGILKAVDTLDDQYTLIKKRDLENIIPKTTTTTTDLIKKLILSQGYATLKSKNRSLRTESEEKSKSLVALVSEIVFGLIVNIDVAKDKITEENPSASDIEAARLMVENSLHKSGERLEKLNTDLQDYLSFTTETLINRSNEFEKYIGHFMGSGEEKHVDHTDLITKLSWNERINYIYRQAGWNFRSKIPNLYKFMTEVGNNVQRVIPKIRRAASFDVAEPEAEEELVRYLTEIDERIQDLPLFIPASFFATISDRYRFFHCP